MRKHTDHAHHEGHAVTFGDRASSYDEGLDGKFSRKFYDMVVANIAIEDGARVLDAGCGTGALLRLLADRHPIEGYGIDVEPNMVEEARKKCPEMTIQVSACDHTPFADRSFDALVTCLAYHHFEDKPGFAREAARILKPGGRLYIADMRFPAPVRASINGVLHHHGIVGAFCTREQIEADFAEHGFEPDGYERDGHAQIVVLKRTAE